MRTVVVIVSALALSVGCKTKEVSKEEVKVEAKVKPATESEAKVSASAEVRPRIGGSLVQVGKNTVEFVAFTDGRVEALVFDEKAKLVAKPEALKLSAKLHAEAEAEPKVELAWDTKRKCFAGDAKAKLEAKPIELHLEIAGATSSAKLSKYVLLDAPRYGGTVLALGEFGAEVFARPSGELQVFVTTADGASFAGGANTELTAKVQTAAGSAADVVLAFDAPRASFVGHLDGGAKLVPGPLELKMELGGKLHLGGIEKLSLAAEAAHGGRVIVAGDSAVELVAKGDTVLAYVLDANAKAHAKGDLDLKLSLDAGKEAALEWDAALGAYTAKLSAGWDLKPIRLALIADGKLCMGAAQSLKADAELSADAKLAADAKLDADAKLGASAKAAVPKVTAKLKASETAAAKAGAQAKAAAKLSVPKPSVKVQVKKSAKTSGSTGAKAGAKAGFSFGTK